MPAIEIGRICVKVSGRETGKRCIILDVIDKNFVLITGPKSVTGVKRRRVNINHIKPTEEKIEIKKDATDEEIARALAEAGKTEEVKQK